MIRRIPPSGMPLRIRDVLAAWSEALPDALGAFRSKLKDTFHASGVGLAGSGSSAFFLLLNALKSGSERREVVLPAYTVPSLHLAVKAAGLDTRLCDIDRQTLNFEEESLRRILGPRTLAVVAVHLFGLPLDTGRIDALTAAVGARLIHDGAQALGAVVEGKPLGHGTAGAFFSFERGKNITAYGGGFAVSSDPDIGRALEAGESDLDLPPAVRQMSLVPTLIAFSLAVRPGIYGLFHFLLRHFRSTRPHAELKFTRLDAFRAAVLLRLWPRLEPFNYRRTMNGRYLYDWMSRMKGVRVPLLHPRGWGVFNRLPVIFEDVAVLERVRAELDRAGIEATVIYPQPVHAVYPDAGYSNAAFPNAEWVAPRLLTLPTHPLMRSGDLERMLAAFERVLSP